MAGTDPRLELRPTHLPQQTSPPPMPDEAQGVLARAKRHPNVQLVHLKRELHHQTQE